MKENINEHDKTKEMMDIIRNGFSKKIIKEEMVQSTPPPTPLEKGDDLPEPERVPSNDSKEQDTIDIRPGDMEYTEEIKTLKNITGDGGASITNFKIYPYDEDVVMEGTLAKNKTENSGIHYKMSVLGGLDTTMTEVKLDSDVSEMIDRLQGYYEKWKFEWASKISDYK